MSHWYEYTHSSHDAWFIFHIRSMFWRNTSLAVVHNTKTFWAIWRNWLRGKNLTAFRNAANSPEVINDASLKKFFDFLCWPEDPDPMDTDWVFTATCWWKILRAVSFSSEWLSCMFSYERMLLLGLWETNGTFFLNSHFSLVIFFQTFFFFYWLFVLFQSVQSLFM